MYRFLGWLFLMVLFYRSSEGRVYHSACRRSCFIKNGEINPAPEFKETYYEIEGSNVACKYRYKMNVQNIDDITFRCEEGNWIGHDQFDDKMKDFTLRNLTCEEKAACDPPKKLNNGKYLTMERYCVKIKGVSRCTGVYYTGDRIYYRCDRGFKARPIKLPQENNALENDNMDGYNEDYDYYADVKEETEEAAPNPEFYCDHTGRWRNNQIDEAPICDRIVCNASHFENISNGYIQNFTETYEYGEVLDLVCDVGYTPISNRDQVHCSDPESFPSKEEFGCKKTTCPVPLNPIGGNFYYLNITQPVDVGSMVQFKCDDFKSKLIGPEVLTCMDNGQWSSDVCTLCVPPDADCPPPCLHQGSMVVSVPDTLSHGSMIQLTCRGDQEVVFNRTCLVNNRWDNSDLHCQGKVDVLKSLSVVASLKTAMKSLQNHTLGGEDRVEGNTIDVGSVGGVDVYFALDVSGSIDETEFRMLRDFTIELTKNINISDRADGTRLAIYAFASDSALLYNGHPITATNIPFKDTEEAIEELGRLLDFNHIQAGVPIGERDQKIGSGTNMKAVINDVIHDVNTKRIKNPITPQQVLVIISDGHFTTSGDPSKDADTLKGMGVQIYSIYLNSQDPEESDKGKKKNTISSKVDKDLMERIASELPDEDHYFEVDDKNFEEIITLMVRHDTPIPCGLTDKKKTKINDNSVDKVQKMIPAKDHAWPWMVQIKDAGGNHICGGSLIDKLHVLTAAHCFFKGRDKIEGPVRLLLKSHRTDDNDTGILEEHVEIRESVKIHENFNQTTKPEMLFDIAIVTLPEAIERFDHAMRAVCLPEGDSGIEAIIPNKTYGVVTGWGKRDKLHQAQMLIPDEETCTRMIPVRKRNEFNTTYMFCAGGQDEGEAVAACKGDSGGPLFIENIGKENTFFQIGVVSFSIGGCERLRYGFYTKLNKELIDWIHTTIKTEQDKAE